jgi:hypothetical protein
MTKPVVLFFARGYQSDFFPTLDCAGIDAVFVTMTKSESRRVRNAGRAVAACFEEDFEQLEPAPVDEGYLLTSLVSDRFLGRFAHARRIEILGKEIAFWARLLDTHRPAAIVNELVAIEISEVLLIECRKRGVNYLAAMNCVVDDYFYWLPDPLSLSGRHLASAEPPSAAALELASHYYSEVVARDYKPFYVRNLSRRFALRPLVVALYKFLLWRLRRLRSAAGAFRYELYDDEYAKRIVVYFRSLYRRYDSLADLPAPVNVVFFPLHQEPEATLNYMSEFYSNQVATIENILKCLRPGQVLVIKEHPVDKGSLLRDKFWKLRRENSSVYFLPAEVHGREVLAASSRVVTLTSTLGWEAAVTGKAVYVLGQIFYDNVPGVVAIRDFEQLKAELRREPTVRGVDVDTVKQFVAQLVQRSFPGNPFPFEGLYTAQNRERVVDAILQAAGIAR